MPKRKNKSKEEKKKRKLEKKLRKYKDKLENLVRHNETPRQDEAENVLSPMPMDSTLMPEVINGNLNKDEENTVLEGGPIEEQLDNEVMEALGCPIDSQSTLGPPIHTEIFNRLENILICGMNKEHLNMLGKNYLVPQNTELLNAPKLNPEFNLVTEAVKTRDTKLEERQQLLGIAVGTILKCIHHLSKKDYNKLEIIKDMTEASRMLAHIHYENTEIRRKLMLPHLDIAISKTLIDVKRDKFLFNEKFNDHIKTVTALQKSAVNILKKPAQSLRRPLIRQTKRSENYQPPQRQGTQRRPFRGAQQPYRQPVTKVQTPAITRRQPPPPKYRQQRARYL